MLLDFHCYGPTLAQLAPGTGAPGPLHPFAELRLTIEVNVTLDWRRMFHLLTEFVQSSNF